MTIVPVARVMSADVNCAAMFRFAPPSRRQCPPPQAGHERGEGDEEPRPGKFGAPQLPVGLMGSTPRSPIDRQPERDAAGEPALPRRLKRMKAGALHVAIQPLKAETAEIACATGRLEGEIDRLHCVPRQWMKTALVVSGPGCAVSANAMARSRALARYRHVLKTGGSALPSLGPAK